MALTNLRTQKDITVTLRDGTTPTALEVVVPYCVGDESLSDLKEKAQRGELIKIFSRGALVGARVGNETQPAIGWSAAFDTLSDAAATRAYDLIMRTDGTPFENAVTTCTGSEVYTLDVEIKFEGTDLGASVDEILLCHDVADLKVGISAGDPISMAFSGEVFGDVERLPVHP